MSAKRGVVLQAQVSADDDADLDDPSIDHARNFSRQSSASGVFPVKEAAAGFKGAFRKVANGIAGVRSHSIWPCAAIICLATVMCCAASLPYVSLCCFAFNLYRCCLKVHCNCIVLYHSSQAGSA